jgi:hypothetical protein
MRTTSAIDTVEIDSVDGKTMMKIRDQLRSYSLAHTSATPLVGLVLSALHVRRLRAATDITRLVFKKCAKSNPCGSIRILERLQELGYVQLILGPSGKRGGTCVYPFN